MRPPSSCLTLQDGTLGSARRPCQRSRGSQNENAGRSSVARDLAVLFEEIEDGHTLVLRRVEANTFARIAVATGMGDLAALLAA